MLHNVAEPCAEWYNVERLEQTTDNSSNSLETFVEGLQVRFSQLTGVSRHIYSVCLCTVSKSYIQNANIILCQTHVI